MATFLTLLLKGSLPAENAKTLPFPEVDCTLDRNGTGPLHLRNPQVAHMVVGALRHHADLKYFDLHAWVVMPNRVHMLITPHVSLLRLMESLQSETEREAQRILHLNERFWDDSWVARMSDNMSEIGHYIERKPVTAGMVCAPAELSWTGTPADSNQASPAES